VAAQPPPPPPLVQKPAEIPTNKPPVTVPTPVTETKPSVKPVIEIESVTIVRPSQLKASLLRDHPEEKQNKPMPAPTTTLVQPVHHEPVPEPPKVITEVKVEAVVVEVQKI
jgi:hypothetical protein